MAARVEHMSSLTTRPDPPSSDGSLGDALERALALTTGVDCLRSFVTELAIASGATTAVVGVRASDPSSVDAIAACVNGAVMERFSYDRDVAVRGTACYLEIELVDQAETLHLIIALMSVFSS